MLDFTRVVGFDWDEGNSRKSLERHGVSQAEAQKVFVDTRMIVLVDEMHSYSEERFHAYGETAAGRRLQVSFTFRGDATLIRVISARDMSRNERARYEKEA